MIPPSLVLIVLADQLGRSVGDMYKGAFGPSIVQVLIFMRSSLSCRCSGRTGAAAAERSPHLRGWALWRRVLWGMVPSIVLIFLVLGTIFVGSRHRPKPARSVRSAPPYWRRSIAADLDTDTSGDGIDDAADRDGGVHPDRLAHFFAGVSGGGRQRWIEHCWPGAGGQTGFLIAVNIFVFFLAFFLDFFEIAFIIIPLLAPVADKLGIDLIWFGVLLCVNMQTSFMHPPFGFALFYLRGIASKRVKARISTGRSAMGRIAIDPRCGGDLLAAAGHDVSRQAARLRSRQGEDRARAAGLRHEGRRSAGLVQVQ